MKLNNCPWCGGTAMTVTYNDSPKCYVTCMQHETCEAMPQTRLKKSRIEAIKAWNSLPNYRQIMIDTMVNEETWKKCFPDRELWT